MSPLNCDVGFVSRLLSLVSFAGSVDEGEYVPSLANATWAATNCVKMGSCTISQASKLPNIDQWRRDEL